MARKVLTTTPLTLQRQRSKILLPTQSLLGALLFLTPFLVLLTIFHFFPIVTAFKNSLQVFSIAGQPMTFAGFANYRDVLSDPDFHRSVWLTLIFTLVKVPLQIVLGLLAALLVLRPGRFTTVVRTSVFLPTVMPIVVVSLLFTFLFDRDLGLVNSMLDAIGLGRPGWLLHPRLAQFVLLTLSLWRDVGFVMLVFLAGLQAVPSSILEAARLDGASIWQEVRYIIIPLLIRSFQFAVVFCTLASVQFVAPIQIMTSGGPQAATRLVGYHIYEEAFSFFDWGRTSAMAIIVVGLLIVVTLIELRLLRANWEY